MEEVNYIFTRLWPWHKLPQWWELAPKKWEQTNPGTEDQPYLKESRWPGQTSKDQLQGDGHGWLCFPTCSPLTSSIHPWNSSLKALAHWFVVGDVSLCTQVCPASLQHCPPPCTVNVWNQANFPPTLPLKYGLLSSEPSDSHFSIAFTETASWGIQTVTFGPKLEKAFLKKWSWLLSLAEWILYKWTYRWTRILKV